MWVSGAPGARRRAVSSSASAFAFRSGVASIAANQYIVPCRIDARTCGSTNAGSFAAACS